MFEHLVKPLKLWDVFRVSTNTKFLNEVFGTNYNEKYIYRKCWWVYSQDTIAWFGHIDGKERHEFVNMYESKDIIKQTYVGTTGYYDGAPLNLNREYRYRLIFEIIDKPIKKYIFQGLFELDRDSSTQQCKNENPSYELVFRKVSDIFPVK